MKPDPETAADRTARFFDEMTPEQRREWRELWARHHPHEADDRLESARRASDRAWIRYRAMIRYGVFAAGSMIVLAYLAWRFA